MLILADKVGRGLLVIEGGVTVLPAGKSVGSLELRRVLNSALRVLRDEGVVRASSLADGFLSITCTQGKVLLQDFAVARKVMWALRVASKMGAVSYRLSRDVVESAELTSNENPDQYDLVLMS